MKIASLLKPIAVAAVFAGTTAMATAPAHAAKIDCARIASLIDSSYFLWENSAPGSTQQVYYAAAATNYERIYIRGNC
ncbi:hypothetical protein [Actinocorallia longicatena]|uniref:Uncharacterized protein n=1 Tax=Actinocorallia longicatena TaxID=111803 RepID=A0ABP6QG78_9ACTN